MGLRKEAARAAQVCYFGHMNNLGKVIGVIILAAMVIGYFGTREKVGDYNSYVGKLRPVLLQQDSILDEIQQSEDSEVAEKVDGWLERSDACLADFQAIAPDDAKIAGLHRNLIERAEAMSKGLRSLKLWAQSQDEKDMEEFARQMALAESALDSFITQRNAYFKKHDMTLDE